MLFSIASTKDAGKIQYFQAFNYHHEKSFYMPELVKINTKSVIKISK